jgi:predicted Zn-dependent protease
MRKAWALISALLVMLASLVPFLAPIAARAQSGTTPVITIRDAETEAFLRGIVHPLFRAAGVDPALVRITLVQARAINAFATSGNRMFINTGLIRQTLG